MVHLRTRFGSVPLHVCPSLFSSRCHAYCLIRASDIASATTPATASRTPSLRCQISAAQELFHLHKLILRHEPDLARHRQRSSTRTHICGAGVSMSLYSITLLDRRAINLGHSYRLTYACIRLRLKTEGGDVMSYIPSLDSVGQYINGEQPILSILSSLHSYT